MMIFYTGPYCKHMLFKVAVHPDALDSHGHKAPLAKIQLKDPFVIIGSNSSLFPISIPIC